MTVGKPVVDARLETVANAAAGQKPLYAGAEAQLGVQGLQQNPELVTRCISRQVGQILIHGKGQLKQFPLPR